MNFLNQIHFYTLSNTYILVDKSRKNLRCRWCIVRCLGVGKQNSVSVLICFSEGTVTHAKIEIYVIVR